MKTFVDRALQQIREQAAHGRRLRAVFDLDNTLADTRFRTLAVAGQFDQRHGTRHFAGLSLDHVRLDGASTARALGLPESVSRAFQEFWNSDHGFWNGENFAHDEVVDEIAGLAHACESAGAEVRWLTGRIEPLKEASVRWLRRYQLPAPNNVYCKPDLSIRTGPFKGQMLDQWHRELGVSLFITEDVRDIIAAQAHNDAVPCVLFDFPLRFEGVPRAGTPVFQANSLTRPKIS